MQPLIYALHNQVHLMNIQLKTGNITNKKSILKRIEKEHNIDATIMKHIQIVKGYGGFHFGVCGIPIEELLFPFWEDKALKKLQIDDFPQLTAEMLFAAVFGIYRILDSTRLDMRSDVQQTGDDHWYFQQTKDGLTINKQYFYEGLRDYVFTGERAEFFYRYLSATSSSPDGGISTIAYLDAAKIEGTYEIIIPDSQFTYGDVLQVLVEKPAYQKLIHKKSAFKSKASLEAVRAGLCFLQQLWDCFSVGDGERIKVRRFDQPKERLVRNQRIERQKWKEAETYRIYEDCHFDQVDFSTQFLESDFLFCTFEGCNFSGTTVALEGVQGIFPILRCTFLNCSHLPKDHVFQRMLKNCKVLYTT